MFTATKRVSLLVSVLVLTSLLLSACQQANANDLLAEIKARGTIRISTDLNYAPQSAAVLACAVRGPSA